MVGRPSLSSIIGLVTIFVLPSAGLRRVGIAFQSPPTAPASYLLNSFVEVLAWSKEPSRGVKVQAREDSNEEVDREGKLPIMSAEGMHQ